MNKVGDWNLLTDDKSRVDWMSRLSEQVIQHIMKDEEFLSYYGKDKVVEECTLAGLARIEKFNPQKGIAFNYFVTVILSFLRSKCRRYKDMNELKKKWGMC